MHSFLISILLAAAAPHAVPPIAYSDVFSERYSVVSQDVVKFPAQTPLEPSVVVRSALGTSVAHLLRTDGTTIPYENAEARISIESELGETAHIRMKGFRSVSADWIGERLLFIRRDIGHVAGVEEIYDVVDGKWLVQQSIHYSLR